MFAGQLLVSLCFAELVARYPISGAVFQWSSRLAGTDFGWFTGWVMVIGLPCVYATPRPGDAFRLEQSPEPEHQARGQRHRTRGEE